MKKNSWLLSLLFMGLAFTGCNNKDDPKTDDSTDKNHLDTITDTDDKDGVSDSGSTNSNQNQDSETDTDTGNNQGFNFVTVGMKGSYVKNPIDGEFILDQSNYTKQIGEDGKPDGYPYDVLNVVIDEEKPLSGTYIMTNDIHAFTYVEYAKYKGLNEWGNEDYDSYMSCGGEVIINSIADGRSSVTLKNVQMKKVNWGFEDNGYQEEGAFVIPLMTIENNNITIFDCTEPEKLDDDAKIQCGIFD